MTRQRSQRGVALAVSLLFLLVVTIVSITAATNSSMGLRMAGNLQDNFESFQAAEAGVYGADGIEDGAELTRCLTGAREPTEVHAQCFLQIVDAARREAGAHVEALARPCGDSVDV